MMPLRSRCSTARGAWDQSIELGPGPITSCPGASCRASTDGLQPSDTWDFTDLISAQSSVLERNISPDPVVLSSVPHGRTLRRSPTSSSGASRSCLKRGFKFFRLRRLGRWRALDSFASSRRSPRGIQRRTRSFGYADRVRAFSSSAAPAFVDRYPPALSSTRTDYAYDAAGDPDAGVCRPPQGFDVPLRLGQPTHAAGPTSLTPIGLTGYSGIAGSSAFELDALSLDHIEGHLFFYRDAIGHLLGKGRDRRDLREARF